MDSNTPDQLQQALLEQIISSFKKKSDAVERISELLHLGKDAVYRRLRGVTLLTPDEIQLLATAFGISVDNLIFRNTDSLIFTMNALSGKIQSFRDFFDDLSTNVHSVPVVAGSPNAAFSQKPSASASSGTTTSPSAVTASLIGASGSRP